MNRREARLFGTGLTAATVVALLAVHAVIRPVPLAAAECCVTCETKEAACYGSCQAQSHNAGDGDSLASCYHDCDDVLWICYRYCTPCTPNPSQCYQYTTYHYTRCAVWNDELQYCEQWVAEHEVTGHRVADGWCTP